MLDDLGIEIIWDRSHEPNRERNDALRIQRGERSKNPVGTRPFCQQPGFLAGKKVYSPRTLENFVPHPKDLGNNAEDIQMRAISEEEVPQVQNLWQRGRTGTER